MATPNETSSLLSRSLRATGNGLSIDTRYGSSTEDHNEDEVLEIVDESIDILASRFIAPPGSFGLSGGVDVFGTSLTRKGVGSCSNDVLRSPSSGAETIRPRPKSPKIQWSISQPGSRRGSATLPLLHKNRSTTSWDDAVLTPTEGEVERGDSFEKQPEYLNGITQSQARACFVGVLLTWFVGLKTFTISTQS